MVETTPRTPSVFQAKEVHGLADVFQGEEEAPDIVTQPHVRRAHGNAERRKILVRHELALDGGGDAGVRRRVRHACWPASAALRRMMAPVLASSALMLVVLRFSESAFSCTQVSFVSTAAFFRLLPAGAVSSCAGRLLPQIPDRRSADQNSQYQTKREFHIIMFLSNGN